MMAMPTIEEHLLELVRIEVEQLLDMHQLGMMRVEARERTVRDFGHHLALGLVAHIPAVPAICEKHEDVSIPLTWWDAFKMHFESRWWFRWYVKKHPAKMRTHRLTVTVQVVAPWIEQPDSGRTFRYMTTTRLDALEYIKATR